MSFQHSPRFLSQYFSWAVKQYQMIAHVNAQTPSLKIIEQEQTTNNNPIVFTIQLSGKNIYPKLSALDLFQDKSLFFNFTEQDQKKILAALPQQHSPILYRIISRTVDRVTKKFYFTIETLKNHKKTYLSVEDIAQQPFSLAGFSKNDVFLIGLEIGKRLNEF